MSIIASPSHDDLKLTLKSSKILIRTAVTISQYIQQLPGEARSNCFEKGLTYF